MKSKLLKCLALPSMLLMSACSTMKSNENVALDPFHQQLAHNYKTIGDSHGNTFDIKSKASFARKASLLMHGKNVQPMMVRGKDNAELEAGRALLMKAIDEKQFSARQLADLQFYYDCWANQSGSCCFNKNKNLPSNCKDKFLDLINKKDECKSADTVYFPINGHCLVRATNTEVIQRFAEMAKGSCEKIIVVGSTDKSGSAHHNKSLSLKRAKVVADQLVSYGIPKHRIKLIALGESKATAEDEPESRNAGLFIEDAEVMKCFRTHEGCHTHHKHHCGHKHKAKKHHCGAKKVVKKKVHHKKKCDE